ncbi:MAG: RNA polymerase sigma factor [Clostridiales bacterium]
MDKNEFVEKVLATESTLYHMAKTILIQDADCENAVQETILKAYQKLDTLKDVDYFKTWLVRILLNECYRLKRIERPQVSYEEYFADSLAENRENYTELYLAIQRLPQNIRIPVILYYVEGYSIEEIKRIMKIPSGTVKSRLAKGRKLLKQNLQKMEVIYE